MRLSHRGNIVLMFWFFLIFVLWSSYFFSPHYQHIQLYRSILLLLLLCFSSFSPAEGWPHSSHAYFSCLATRRRCFFWGDTLWWNRRRGEVCTVQELIAHECSSTEERPCRALFKGKNSLKDVIVPLVNAWQVFELPLVGWARLPSNKSTKWKKTIHVFVIILMHLFHLFLVQESPCLLLSFTAVLVSLLSVLFHYHHLCLFRLHKKQRKVNGIWSFFMLTTPLYFTVSVIKSPQWVRII